MTDVIRVEDILQSVMPAPSKTLQKVDSSCESEGSEDEAFKNVRGRIVSGRFWKSQKKPARTAIKTRGLKYSLAKKLALRDELKKVKELSRSIKNERLEAKLEKKRRREENLKRAEENRKKSEVVQVIKNTAKIKRMKKKQLRQIEKRDTNKMKEKNVSGE